MARRFLKSEITEILESAITLLSAARQTVVNGEMAVQKLIRVGASPGEVNVVGQEAWQSAGISIRQAINSLEILNPDATTGLLYPIVAAIGTPPEFDRVHFDAVSGSNKFVIDAYNSTYEPLPSFPFTLIADGDTVLIEKVDRELTGSPENLEQLSGAVFEVEAVTSTGGTPNRPRLRMTRQHRYYRNSDGAYVEHVASDAGGESKTFQLRVIDR